MKSLLSTMLVLLALAPAARAGDAPKKRSAAKPEPVFITAEEIKWGDVPPALPPGAQIAVLYGDPFKKNAFTVRLKMPDGYKIPPHWHTQDEQLSILSGTFVLHMGDTMDSPAHELSAGAYHFLPGKAHHAAEVKGETILQLHGMGPFDIHYLNPADDPSKAAAASAK